MTRARLLAFNAVSMLVANIIAKFVLFIGLIYLLQFLDSGLESVYYLITAFAALVTMNFQDGMISITIRKIATDLDNGAHHLGTCYLASLLLGLVLLLIGIPAVFIYANSTLEGSGLRGEFTLAALAMTGAYLIGYGASTAGAGFKAYEKLSIEAALIVLHALLSAGVYVVGSKMGWPLSKFFIALFIVTFIYVVIVNIVLIAFVVKPRIHCNVSEAWALFRESLGLGYGTLLRTLQDRMHPFFIKSLIGQPLITQFSSPNQLLVQLKFIPLSVRPAIFPTLARKAEDETGAFQNYATALMKFLYLVALPMITLLIVARGDVLPLVTSMDVTFENEYAMALRVYPYVGLAVALSFPSQVLRSLFVALKKPEFEFHTVLTGVIVLAVLDYFLIKNFGILGAGYAAVACELTILIYGFWLLERIGRPLNVLNLFLLPTLCGIITFLLAEHLYGVHWLFGVASVLVVFPVLVLSLRVVSPLEWAIVREVIKPGSSADQ